jgi:hypothetical protein
LRDTLFAFDEDPDVATITTRSIIAGTHAVNYVSHDEDDGGWQFLHLSEEPFSMEDAAVVALSSIIALDQTLNEVADLPMGWCATRDDIGLPWTRSEVDQ